jgi:dihydrofolate reductase
MKPTLIYYVAASLDGYIARPDGRVDWLEPIQASRDDHGYHAFYDGIDALLMGRTTFDTLMGFEGDWPYPGKPCLVLTRHPLDQLPEGVDMRHCTPIEALTELAEQGHQRIWLVGGGSLAGALSAGCRYSDVLQRLGTQPAAARAAQFQQRCGATALSGAA